MLLAVDLDTSFSLGQPSPALLAAQVDPWIDLCGFSVSSGSDGRVYLLTVATAGMSKLKGPAI